MLIIGPILRKQRVRVRVSAQGVTADLVQVKWDIFVNCLHGALRPVGAHYLVTIIIIMNRKGRQQQARNYSIG